MRARMLQEPSTPAYLSGAPCTRVPAYCSATLSILRQFPGGPEHARVPSPPNPAARFTAAVPLPTDPSLDLGQSVTAAYSLVSLMAVTSIAALGTAIRRPKFAGSGVPHLIRLAHSPGEAAASACGRWHLLMRNCIHEQLFDLLLY